MKLYTYRIYDCSTQKYVSALSIHDATKRSHFNTMWSLQGLRLKTNSNGIYAKIGEREIALPHQADHIIPWNEIEDTIYLYQVIGNDIINFLNIEVNASVDENTWQAFKDSSSIFLDNEARISMNVLELNSKIINLTKAFYNNADIINTLAHLEKTLEEVNCDMGYNDSNYETLSVYKHRLEQLRYDICIELLRSDINDEVLRLRAIAIVLEMSRLRSIGRTSGTTSYR